MTDNDNPTIVDVARALPSGEEGNAGADILGMVVASMERTREYHQGLQDGWWANDRAEIVAMRHGIAAAFAQSDWGGTTRSYEITLDRIERAMANARYDGPIRRYYRDQVKLVGEFQLDQIPPHPAYAVIDYDA